MSDVLKTDHCGRMFTRLLYHLRRLITYKTGIDLYAMCYFLTTSLLAATIMPNFMMPKPKILIKLFIKHCISSLTPT